MKAISLSQLNHITKVLSIPIVLLFGVGISVLAAEPDELSRANQSRIEAGTPVAQFQGGGEQEVVSYQSGAGSAQLQSEVRTMSRQNSAAAESVQERTGIDKGALTFRSINTAGGLAATFTNIAAVDLKGSPNTDETDAIRVMPGKLVGVMTPDGNVTLFIRKNDVGSFRDYGSLDRVEAPGYRENIIHNDREVSRGIQSDKSYSDVKYLKLTPIGGVMGYTVEPINRKSPEYRILEQIPPIPSR